MAKLISTTKICYTLFMARTFGEYEHSVWDNGLNFAIYTYKGNRWAFPLAPLED